MKRGSETPSSSNQEQKKVAEKNWRNRINDLCSDLTSIVPPEHFQPFKDMLSQADKIEQATNYIVELRERVDNLNKRKGQLEMTGNQEAGTSSNQQNTTLNDVTMADSALPIIDVKDLGSSLEVQLVMTLEDNIMLHEVIRILEEEGAEVVNATFSTSGNKVIHTLHAKVRNARIGIETSRVKEKLHALI
ncbi:transcription factor bHLH168-like [Beta vulgaris subsp. vulgaris]|uniref:transcription factor bHLH168-like n=1 Tax=Beta vulgaris subsp. vulgaris TaxID=3555 RepID=UPI002037544E|nr:transcription factor bHLH168-like [Beta vulgaris subsp. vulgaris]